MLYSCQIVRSKKFYLTGGGVQGHILPTDQRRYRAALGRKQLQNDFTTFQDDYIHYNNKSHVMLLTAVFPSNKLFQDNNGLWTRMLQKRTSEHPITRNLSSRRRTNYVQLQLYILIYCIMH
jgi:hypothetical protein